MCLYTRRLTLYTRPHLRLRSLWWLQRHHRLGTISRWRLTLAVAATLSWMATFSS